MTKKKIKPSFDEPVYNDIVKDVGDVITKGNDLLDRLEDLKVLSFSPALDLALGGGLREGTCVIISGDPKTCKSSSALHFLAKAQKAGKPVAYLDVENRLVKENFKGIKGLDADNLFIMGPTLKVPKISAEQYLNGLEKMVQTIPELVAVVDSTSSMVPHKELFDEIELSVRAGNPRLLSMFLKRISGPVVPNKSILIFITHNISNTNRRHPNSPEKKPDSGVMLQYQAGTNMAITYAKGWEANGREIGKTVSWKILTSAAGGFPNTKAESWFRYNLGIDETKEIVQIGIEFSLISVAGSWYKIQYAIDNQDNPVIKDIIEKSGEEDVEKIFKKQGMDKIVDFLSEHDELRGLLYKEIMDMINES